MKSIVLVLSGVIGAHTPAPVTMEVKIDMPSIEVCEEQKDRTEQAIAETEWTSGTTLIVSCEEEE